MIEFVLVSLLAYNFPSYFDTEQELNAAVIIDKSLTIGEDPYFMVSLAWVESRLKSGRVSHTGDYGIFQINYNCSLILIELHPLVTLHLPPPETLTFVNTFCDFSKITTFALG